jgi:hypothetical protein
MGKTCTGVCWAAELVFLAWGTGLSADELVIFVWGAGYFGEPVIVIVNCLGRGVAVTALLNLLLGCSSVTPVLLVLLLVLSVLHGSFGLHPRSSKREVMRAILGSLMVAARANEVVDNSAARCGQHCQSRLLVATAHTARRRAHQAPALSCADGNGPATQAALASDARGAVAHIGRIRVSDLLDVAAMTDDVVLRPGIFGNGCVRRFSLGSCGLCLDEGLHGR